MEWGCGCHAENIVIDFTTSTLRLHSIVIGFITLSSISRVIRGWQWRWENTTCTNLCKKTAQVYLRQDAWKLRTARDKNGDGFCAGAWVSADSALKMKGSGTPKKHHRTSKSTERACTFESKFARLHVRFHTRRDVCVYTADCACIYNTCCTSTRSNGFLSLECRASCLWDTQDGKPDESWDMYIC